MLFHLSSFPSISFHHKTHCVCFSSLSRICCYQLSISFAQFGYSEKRDIVIPIVVLVVVVVRKDVLLSFPKKRSSY